MMGHEPIATALTAGADVVLAGRATDTALAAAFPLLHGLPAGPTWHAAKIVECGGQCTTNPRAGGVLATIDATGFTIEPLDPDARCTPTSVAAHMLYETVNPFSMREPAGTIVVSDATYTALDDRRIRVSGSRFEPAAQHTIKLEGARITGYETMSFTAIRDPHILSQIDTWAALLRRMITEWVTGTLGLTPDEYAFDVRLYGHNAILEDIEPARAEAPREVGVMLLVNAPDQQTATAVAKVANPLMLHLPTPDMDYLPSLAFATSPAETERGAAYEFVLNHVVVDSPTALFRTSFPEGLTMLTVADLALEVRSKNAGPFWVTMEIFLKDEAAYAAVLFVDAPTIAHLYNVPADTVQIFRIPSLNVVKISFPRPVTPGSLQDRDIHAGQHHVPLALFPSRQRHSNRCSAEETRPPPRPTAMAWGFKSPSGHADPYAVIHFM